MPIYIFKQTAKDRMFSRVASLVVRAASEASARRLAAKDYGAGWMDATRASCEIVRLVGPPKVLLEVPVLGSVVVEDSDL